ncbi:hypothetical protein J2X47_000619 [Sphingomonas sp. BE270]|jgi:hypothetical protein|nr:hypothetical protein [Sphingomonas sp. BE270]
MQLANYLFFTTQCGEAPTFLVSSPGVTITAS